MEPRDEGLEAGLTFGWGVPSGVSVGVGATEASDLRGGMTFLAVGLYHSTGLAFQRSW